MSVTANRKGPQMEKREVLTEKHAYWRGFMIRLNDMVNTREYGQFLFNCRHDLSFSTKILKSLPNIDVEGSIEYLKSKGGFCDCEVLMNID